MALQPLRPLTAVGVQPINPLLPVNPQVRPLSLTPIGAPGLAPIGALPTALAPN